MKLNISYSVPEFGANMAQVTLGKFFSGVPKFDGEGANHVTENELKFHVECSLNKNRLPVISFNYFCSSSFNV